MTVLVVKLLISSCKCAAELRMAKLTDVSNKEAQKRSSDDCHDLAGPRLSSNSLLLII